MEQPKLPRFYPILDTAVLAARSCSAIHSASALLGAGATILQYRHKENWTQLHYDEAKQIAVLCREAGALFVLNDRADFAKLLDSALHIGQEDLPPAAVRRILPKAPVGFSTHNRLQLTRANNEPVDYLSLGPIFATSSKFRPDPVVGIDGLRTLRPLATKPLVAIGGINQANALDVLSAGADSVAIISALLPEGGDLRDLNKHAADWMTLLQGAPSPGSTSPKTTTRPQ